MLPAGCFSFYGGFERAAGAILRENPKGSTLTLGMGTGGLGKGRLVSRVGRETLGRRSACRGGDGPPSPIRMGHPNVFTFYFKALDSGPEQKPGLRCQPGRVAAGTLRATRL